jgi:hypothetical protein
MIDELEIIWKKAVWPNLIYSSIGLERLRKPTKTLTGKAGLQAEF